MENNWDAHVYDQKFTYVSAYGTSLVELLDPKQGERILDLGCGTGDLAKTIHEYGVDIVGVDKSENMVDEARRKYPQLQFFVKDATKLVYDHEFDAVFSNATLHWIPQASEALQGIYRSLKPGGRFIAEFGGKGNIQTIENEVIRQMHKAGTNMNREHEPWFFPSIGEYSTLMEEVGFRVTFAQHFDRPTPLEGEHGLRSFIAMFFNNHLKGISQSTKMSLLNNIEHNLKSILYREGQWIADYKRIRVVGVKEY